MTCENKKELDKIIKKFRLLDDDFMSMALDNKEAIELILRIILKDNKISIKEFKIQKEQKSINGRSVRFDVYAINSDNEEIDIEVQRSNKGATERRARYNSSLLDNEMLKKGTDFIQLKDSYVIFITEHDVLKAGKPLYHIDRTIKELDNQYFNDGSHIIYVNGEYQGTDDIGKLMNDFRSKNPEDMNFEILKNRVKYFKEEGGRDSMCKLVEDYGNKRAKEEKNKNIIALLKQGVSAQTIHEALKVPLKAIQELENSIKVSK